MQTAGITRSRRILAAIPNTLTAARLVLTTFFIGYLNIFLEQRQGIFTVLLLFACICLLDYFDGVLARKLGAVTRAGAIFDVTADCIYVWSSLFVLALYGAVPWWFLALAFYKFAEFIITSYILKRRIGQNGPFVFDPAGKAAGVLFLLMPGNCCIILCFAIIPQPAIILCMLLCVLALVVWSSVKRIKTVARAFA